MPRSSQACHFIVFAALATTVYSQQPTSWRDPSAHTVRLVTVEENVRLEVLDWGGSGRPVILLAGGGITAHVYDDFAPKLAADFHVYGITRRGFGASGFAVSNERYPLDRLRDDILAVIDALELKRPVLAGHSIAGAELSAVATLHPDRIGGLVYLDAGYPYAFDNGKGPKMKEFPDGPGLPSPSESDLASFSSLQKWDADVFGFARPEAELRHAWDADSSGRPRNPRRSPGARAFAAILTSDRAYARIPVPALVIYAFPHVPERWFEENTDRTRRDSRRAYYAIIDAATE